MKYTASLFAALCAAAIVTTGYRLGLGAPDAQALPEHANAADAFVDSIGVVTHLEYQDTAYYRHWPEVRALLLQLGVRHLRGVTTGFPPTIYARVNDLAANGIRPIFVTRLTDTDAAIEEVPRIVPSIEYVEGPNEVGNNRSPDWIGPLRDFMQRLRHDVDVTPAFPSKPIIIMPSLTSREQWLAIGDLTPFINYANIHDYIGINPGTRGTGSSSTVQGCEQLRHGSIRYNTCSVGAAAKSLPVIATETGYQSDDQFHRGAAVPDDVIARYIPRLIAEQWNAGVVRTYIYQFVDAGSDQFHYTGLVLGTMQPKPQYFALRNMISTLADPGPRFSPGTLRWSLAHARPASSRILGMEHHVLLQKRDGSFHLLLWLEDLSYRPGSKSEVPVPPHEVTLVVPPEFRNRATLSTVDNAGKMSTHPLSFSNDSAALTLTDSIEYVHLRPAGAH